MRNDVVCRVPLEMRCRAKMAGGVASADFNSGAFGTVVRARDPRLIQFALKFIF